ncbi:Dihydrolipoamide acetyltransferase [Minicystis rosea]|nr:Dihydrolipoamide acetyltransferase [Minicystis rosea]
MRTAFLFTLVLPLLLMPASAHADDNVARAKKSFAAAAKAYREARYKDAIDLFLEANRIDPHAELIYNVGQAYEKLGDVPSALRSYREYLRLAPTISDRVTIEASIKNLEARLRERGVQQVSIFSSPAGATLLLDQKIVGQTPWTGEIAPGRHLAILKSTGHADATKEFVLLPDRAMDLDIALPFAAPAPAAPKPELPPAPPPPPTATAPTASVAPTAPQPPPPPPPDTPKKPRIAPWTIAALGVGVASFGGAIAFELLRKSAENDARNDPTQVGFHDKLDTMTGRQTAARVFVGIGSVATAAGAVFLFLDLRPQSSPTPAKAGLGCFDGACGAFVSGRF